MKQLFIILIAIITFIACSKKDIPVPTPNIPSPIKDSIVGIWSGRYNTDRKNPEDGIKWCMELKANDSIIVYNVDSLPNPTGSIIKGKWSIIENKIAAYWIYGTDLVRQYSFIASISNQQKSMDGYYFNATNPTNKYPFFFNKLPK